jgi:1-deoxy-D-xylulose-5-phosphate synthase
MARARTLLGQNYDVVTLLGDGAATGGMVYEGLNDAAVSREPMVIILNDNEMSIDKNVGGMSRHLSLLRTKEKYLGAKKKYRSVLYKIPGGKAIYGFTKRIKDRLKRFLLPTTIFENMGLTYLGPVNGHDLPGLIALLRNAKELGVPVLVHVMTKKGCGYLPAEEDPARFHGIGKFEPFSGKKLGSSMPTYSDIFGQTMMELAERNPKICAITAAMPGGTGLQKFKQKYPRRTFDVGIAEEHAVSMAGGLAKQGMIPVVAIYSTFLQRGFDQMMQDVALLGLHVVFAIDRAGLVGEDGPTHHGVFDIGYLRQIPGMKVLCPANFDQLQKMLRWAVEECTGPVAVRYPRGSAQLEDSNFAFRLEDVPCLRSGDDVSLISYGSLLKQVMQAAAELAERNIHAQVLQISSVTDFSVDLLVSQLRGKDVFVIEEAAASSGIKQTVAWELQKRGYSGKFHGLDLGSDFTPHGDMDKLYRLAGIDADSIVEKVQEVLCNEE